jgi:hypothetical protein
MRTIFDSFYQFEKLDPCFDPDESARVSKSRKQACVSCYIICSTNKLLFHGQVCSFGALIHTVYAVSHAQLLIWKQELIGFAKKKTIYITF